MDSVDYSVLKAARDWLNSHHAPIWLVTVVETFGSSPRPPGSMLVIRADGISIGSVSGGCIEDDIADRARTGNLPDHVETVVYGVSTEEARAFGLPCGGSLKLVIEPLHSPSWLDEMLVLITQHRLISRQLDMLTGKVTLLPATPDDELRFADNVLTTIHGPQWRLLIIGAGQTSTYLAQMAQALDYEVLVCDPREEFRSVWNVSGTSILPGMPDDVVLEIEPDSRTAIVALTHDPKLDDMALLEALKSPAFYVGALGSRTNSDKRRERLALFDLSAEEIARLHGPVGLSIHSRTPPEIAVAILAHIIAVKNQGLNHKKVAIHPGARLTAE